MNNTEETQAAGGVLARGAVEKHLRSIFGKLGLARSEADHRRVLAYLHG